MTRSDHRFTYIRVRLPAFFLFSPTLGPNMISSSVHPYEYLWTVSPLSYSPRTTWRFYIGRIPYLTLAKILVPYLALKKFFFPI
jgi:hypothetical protein